MSSNGLINTTSSIEIIAFRLHSQEFCVKTTTIREIRGWGKATPIPHAPDFVLGIMNLRGTVIPIIDLARKLGMASVAPSERSAIVVAEIHGVAFGLVVDQVSDILTVNPGQIQPVPPINIPSGAEYADGIIVRDTALICFLNLDLMFDLGHVQALDSLPKVA
nr:chemotaxis protein CheW [uncultured Gellertiella sp.]